MPSEWKTDTTVEAIRRRSVLLPLLCVVLALAFFQTTYWSNDGRPTFPTDDSYIYFQYAKQLVSGHPFEYNTGDAPTTGMTSILYWLLVSAGYLAGFRGESIFYFVFMIGLAGLLVSVNLVRKIGEVLAGKQAGLIAALLFCINGQIVWGYFAGLEIPLFTTLLLSSVFFFLKDLNQRTYSRTMISCALLTLSRPEGLFVGCLLALFLPFAILLRSPREGTRTLSRQAFWVILPFFASFAYLAVNMIVGGRISPTTASTKSLWNYPEFYRILYTASYFLLDSVKGLFGAVYPSGAEVGSKSNSVVPYFAPFALFFFLFGSFTGAARELLRKDVGASTVLLLVFTAGITFASFASPSGFQHHRYLIPFYPAFIICMTGGIYRFCGTLARGRKRVFLRGGILAFMIAVTAAGLAVAFCDYTFESVMIRTSTASVAEWAKENLEESDVMGIADAGVLKYYSGRRTVDLLGLTTRRLFARWMLGWGAVVEELKHMERGERPTHFVMLPSFARQSKAIEPLYAVMGERVYEPWPIYLAGQTVFKADYASFDAGRLPLYEPQGWVLVDSLDVGYLGDEERCGYRTLYDRPVLRFDVGLKLASYGDGPIIADGGRIVLAGEKFTISTEPGKALKIVLRSARSFATYRFSPVLDGYITSSVSSFSPVLLEVNGRRLEGAGISTPSYDRWHETVLEIPPEFIVSQRTSIKIQGSYNSFHYWFFQE
jgi:4-amino-4-deoxy-L-arabinose transferase-like glycosyltransferase